MPRQHARKISVVPRLCSGLAATLVAITLTVWLVAETIASVELRNAATVDEAPTTATRALAVSLPVAVAPPIQAAPIPSLRDDGVSIRHYVGPDETFVGILAARGLARAEIQAWQQAAASVYRLDKLRAGNGLSLTFARGQGRLTGCEYEIDKHSLLSMQLVNGQIRARLKAMPRRAAVRGVVGSVGASLVTSATAVGMPVQTISALGALFGWDLDLERDLRAGDEFRLIYEELRDEDGSALPGDILAAEIANGGRRYTAFRFENERGQPEYYDADGRALGRPFLKYPVDLVTISSRFSGSRLHPLLKRRRPHVGVDFAAPMGTPVKAVASGVVTFAGRNGEYGIHVGIEHDAPYASSYSHLQRVARGVRPGASVSKGQVIGYVGRSGLASGPHLHFMFFENGTYVNPLTVRLRVDEKLTGARWRRFAKIRADLRERLASFGNSLEIASIALPPSLPEIVRSHAASYVD